MGRSPEILAPGPVGEQGGPAFESGLDPRAPNKRQSREGAGVRPRLASSRPPHLPRKADRDPQHGPRGGASAQADLSSRDTPTQAWISLAFSLHLLWLALSPSPLFLTLLPVLALPSISFSYHLV